MTETPATSKSSGIISGRVQDLLDKYRFSEPLHVTRPTLPELDRYTAKLVEIWRTRRLTNQGPVHDALERNLARHLGVEHLSLTCNGTVALQFALRTLDIDGGEVITTPFTFPATIHVLHWRGIRPVFCDIEANGFNLDPARIEALVGPDTRAILAVHTFGNPCDVAAIQSVADRHGLSVIYDAAHAFGVRVGGRTILDSGDLSVLSFHATKTFTTIEGGAVTCSTSRQKSRVDLLRNFGIAGEETVNEPGLNGKLNELQAAFGLLKLETIDAEIEQLAKLAAIYRKELAGLDGLSFSEPMPSIDYNFGYFPILVDVNRYGMSRDQLYATLKRFNVHPRKYFHPLCSTISCYASLPSAHPDILPVATRVAGQVLCLPIYTGLDPDDVVSVCDLLRELPGAYIRATESIEPHEAPRWRS